MNKKMGLMMAMGLLISAPLLSKDYLISTPRTSLLITANEGEKSKMQYYGVSITPVQIQNIYDAGLAFEADSYPAFGLQTVGEKAVAITHADGNMSLDLGVDNVKQYGIDDGEILEVLLKDKIYPVWVKQCYKAYKGTDIITTWVEIGNAGKKPVTLFQFASAYLPMFRGDNWLTHFHGAWGAEHTMDEEKLTNGQKVIANKDGLANTETDNPSFMLSLDGKPQEETGKVFGGVLAWSGNYKLKLDVRNTALNIIVGMNEESSQYILEPKETFVTPEFAMTYSTNGKGGVSRAFHHWARQYKMNRGERLHDILLNSWEGVYFKVNQKGMDEMMEAFSAMGGELFVMDDGWFGDKYPRKNDSSSLGDWVVDKNKLPNGIGGLLSDAKKHGVKFGIWIEPEMANTTSELYEKHPDWVLKASERDVVLGRGGTQVVLDLANPAVQDFVFGVVDNLMTSYPEIDYIKWDANMSVQNHGSQYLTKDNQSHMYIEFHRGFEKICQRIRAKYPDLTIQACASGGGRANYGVLPYFDEFWVSDNTDALQRVYMQWGTSYFFPAIAMASHISAAPNHQTFRTIPLKYRIDVAMSGRLGMEIQPKNMTEEEKALCKNAIAEYKTIRPVVQLGDIYRLLSPYDKQGVASLMYVAPEKDKAVFYWWKTEHFCNQHLPRVKMAGLCADKQYRVHELNRIDNVPLNYEGKSFSGAYLMANGLEIPYNHKVDYHKQNDYSSRVLYLEEVK